MDHYNKLRFAEHLAPTYEKYRRIPPTEFSKVCDHLWRLKEDIKEFCKTIAAQQPVRKNLILLAEGHFDKIGAIAATMFMKPLQGKYDLYLEGSGKYINDPNIPPDILSTDLLESLNLFPVTRLDTLTSSSQDDSEREQIWIGKMFPTGLTNPKGKIALIGGNHVASLLAAIRSKYSGFDGVYRPHIVQLYAAGPQLPNSATPIRLDPEAVGIIENRFPPQNRGRGKMQERTLFMIDVAAAIFTFEEVAAFNKFPLKQ